MFSFIPLPYRLLATILAFVGTFAAGGIASGVVVHKLDQAAMDKHLRQDAAAAQKATDAARKVEHAVADVGHAAGVAEVTAQRRITDHTLTLTQEVPSAVHTLIVDRVCVPVGLVRLHDAAAYGIEPAQVGASPGEPDDACSLIAWPDFAAVVVQNYGIARGNAEQLDALIKFERDRLAVFNGDTSLGDAGTSSGGMASAQRYPLQDPAGSGGTPAGALRSEDLALPPVDNALAQE